MRPPLAAGTDLTVGSLPGDHSAIGCARVIYCAPYGKRWRVGCAWQRHLTDGELEGLSE
jgi:hypothetical protein